MRGGFLMDGFSISRDDFLMDCNVAFQYDFLMDWFFIYSPIKDTIEIGQGSMYQMETFL